jgi:4-aminobutyrate aminotransferase-like enzyme
LEKGNYFIQKLKDELMKKYHLIGDVREQGLMISIELVKDKDKLPEAEEATQIQELCRENNLLIGLGGIYGNVLRIQPPLLITEKQLDKDMEIPDDAVAANYCTKQR